MHKLTFRKFKRVENVTVYENGEMILMNLCGNDSYVHCKKDGHKILQNIPKYKEKKFQNPSG